jgi:hypothetical protein
MHDTTPIHFVVQGQLLPSAGRLVTSVRPGARRSPGKALHVVATPGRHAVQLQLAGGPALFLHPQTARELLLGQGLALRSAGLPGAVAIPAQLRWAALEQLTGAALGEAMLERLDVLTLEPGPVDLADLVDRDVADGVFALQPETLPRLRGNRRPPDPVAAAAAPLLVLLHDAFVDTQASFGHLWTLHPSKLRDLFQHHAGNVVAFEHPTVGTSPIANALALAQAMPSGARLHLLGHGRGGLVAELLARVCGRHGQLGAGDLAQDTGQRRQLQQLADVVRDKHLGVDRVLRVACPARGTLLASRRLDAHASVLAWALELASMAPPPGLVAFQAAVAGQRTDPRHLPGLAAMLPDSPLVQWLNAADTPIPGDLRVLAGDLQGDSLGSWVKTLQADCFEQTDGDLLAPTASMFGGSVRLGGASFLRDQGGKATHFNHFANEATAGAVCNALMQDQPAGFRAIGSLSWDAADDAGGHRPAAAAADKPAVFVLPGMLGSHLQVGGQRIWLSLPHLGALQRLAWQGSADSVLPDGPIGPLHDALIRFLQPSHEVIPFAFDWRRPIEDEARRLADAVTSALDCREGNRQPVRLLAHSMGGLVARTLHLERPEVWQRMMDRAGARVVLLGTPNAGSWAPMQMLSGDDAFGNALAALGTPFEPQRLRQTMAGMPGFLQLQAGLPDSAQGLADAATWRRLADADLQRVHDAVWWHHDVFGAEGGADLQLDARRWGVPPQSVLDAAVALRRRLDAQCATLLPTCADRLAVVVGHAPSTPDGWGWSDDTGLSYLDGGDGDGRVALASALLPGVATWAVEADHGSLPAAEPAFGAYLDLLQHGSTLQLPRLTGPATVPPPLRSRPARALRSDVLPAADPTALLSPPKAAAAMPATGTALRVTVLNGNLTFIHHPLLLGHYRASVLTGTERVVDHMIGGQMKASLAAGLYPDGPGSHQIFVNTSVPTDNPWRAPRPGAVVVLGLGSEGEIDVGTLARSVRQAVLAWSQRLTEKPGGSPAVTELAATLIGSGGLGISPGAAACAIAQGVRDANLLLAAGGWPVVGQLWLVELYLERAADAWRSLQIQGTATPGRYEVAPAIASGTGPLRRQLDSTYRGTDYDLITAETRPGGDDGVIAYRLDTRRARTEVQAQVTQAALVRNLVARAANDANTDPAIGRTLFQLLVPTEMEPFVGGSEPMVLELDDGTAGIPWELLDVPAEERAGGDARPWAIRSRLLRKLRLTDFRTRVVDAGAEDHVLVIGPPRIDDPAWPPLPGAEHEARAVAAALGGDSGVGTQHLTAVPQGADAAAILNALFARRYRIVHIAGHGQAVPASGVVMSDGTLLGAREIEAMRTVPELVFVNCCHLAARDQRQLLAPLDRARFAADVARALIAIGVRCVVAAGWAVEDVPASLFATRFYASLLAGEPFIAAVAAAREEAWQHADGGNTWAAYQCYGDPNWVFRRSSAATQSAREEVLQEFANISSPLGLTLALEELAVHSRYHGAGAAAQRQKIRHLEARFGALWTGMGAVAEAFGLACAEARDLDAAIAWYARASACNDGSASMRAAEQAANARVRRAWERALAGAPADRAVGRAEIGQTLVQIDALLALHPTPDRHSLRGSAWKRLAMLDTLDGRSQRRSLAQATSAYRAAVDAAGDGGGGFRPAINLLSAAVASHAGSTSALVLDPEVVQQLRASLRRQLDEEPDFWSMVGVIELDLIEALAAGRLAGAAADLRPRLADLHSRVPAPQMWASVADNTRFMLAPWAARQRSAAAAAARALLAQLDGYAKT